MKRREFITLLGGAVVASLTQARAQQVVRRVGALIGAAETDPESQARILAFEHTLQALGWTDGRNIHIDYRFGSGDPDLTQKYAAELVGLAPDVILANSPLVVRALHQLTSTIPIVFALVVDPIGEGFIRSLAQAGRKYHRIYQLRIPAERKMAGTAQRGSAQHSSGKRRQPSRKRYSGRILACVGERGVSSARAIGRNSRSRCRRHRASHYGDSASIERCVDHSSEPARSGSSGDDR
jgi:ABC transporter substrate binding protein